MTKDEVLSVANKVIDCYKQSGDYCITAGCDHCPNAYEDGDMVLAMQWFVNYVRLKDISRELKDMSEKVE